ncbi:MAG: hypothetical protein K0S47_4343 [Herbinix sp.]|nr:hypothetical protein [Herbinix sp.]
MLICPVCKSEYQEGFKTCSDCKCDLIEIPDVIVKSKPLKVGKIIQFLIGILIILYSPILSYHFTSNYFIGSYDPDRYLWMLKAFHSSFLLAGSIICLPSLIYWWKRMRRK